MSVSVELTLPPYHNGIVGCTNYYYYYHCLFISIVIFNTVFPLKSELNNFNLPPNVWCTLCFPPWIHVSPSPPSLNFSFNDSVAASSNENLSRVDGFVYQHSTVKVVVLYSYGGQLFLFPSFKQEN